jgi:hypothetical protein
LGAPDWGELGRVQERYRSDPVRSLSW